MKKDIFRYAGEFEPQESVMLCWPEDSHAAAGYHTHDVFVQVIQNLIGEVSVYVNCGVEGSISTCKAALY